ncbi:unnamed protein product [Orchesella dallaii]|uniref:Uncharacterized protein n=1 Tax=Orchesella dallaii TaxID=48710 RepID=A0ABP1RC76_9HEXA
MSQGRKKGRGKQLNTTRQFSHSSFAKNKEKVRENQILSSGISTSSSKAAGYTQFRSRKCCRSLRFPPLLHLFLTGEHNFCQLKNKAEKSQYQITSTSKLMLYFCTYI